MSEVKIARFVDIEACKSIFSDKSTFVLRSPVHYQRLYETSGGAKGDIKEGRPDTDSGTSEFMRWVVSCWTLLGRREPTSEEWDIFKEDERNIVAIVSTPSRVCKFLNRVFMTGEKPLFWQVEHREVEYDKEKVHVDHTNITDVVPFAKDKRFEKEHEYRFVLKYGWGPHLIDSFIFCGGVDYMEPSFANPRMCEQDKKMLLSILSEAMAGYGDFKGKSLGDIISNIEEILNVKS